MGRLNGLIIYLAGAIDRCPNYGVQWRDELSKKMFDQFGIHSMNPMKKPDFFNMVGEHEYRELRKTLKENEDYEQLSEYIDKIVDADFKMLDISNCVIAYIDLDVYACGTMFELYRAYDAGKLVFIVCKQGKKSIPDWLFGFFNHSFMFDSFDELLHFMEIENV